MFRLSRLVVLCAAVLMVLFGAVVVTEVLAASDQKQEEKNKEKKEKSNDKGKSGGAKDGVNKMFDGFKKNQGGVMKDADKVKKSTNESYDKSK